MRAQRTLTIEPDLRFLAWRGHSHRVLGMAWAKKAARMLKQTRKAISSRCSPPKRSRLDHSVTISIPTVHNKQVVLVDRSADSPAEVSCCHLVGSEMNAAVDASV